MTRRQAVIGSLRISFLPLTVACVFLGVAAAHWTDASISPISLALVSLGALSAHASVNAFNEYFDFRSGIDLHTVRTPFSGGSGALPAQPQAAGLVLATAGTASAVTILCGLLLVQRVGPGLLPFGVAGLVLVYSYTQWLNRIPLLSLIASGAGFGLMVFGTYFVFAREADIRGLLVALPVFFLVNNLLLLNQFPDVDPDRQAGRRHLPIVIGRRNSAWVLGGFFVATYVVLIAAVLFARFPAGVLLGWLTAPIAASVFTGARRDADNMSALIPYMARNVLVTLLTPVLIGIGFLLPG